MSSMETPGKRWKPPGEAGEGRRLSWSRHAAWWSALLLVACVPAWLAWGAAAKDKPVAWIGHTPVLLSQVQHDENLVLRNFAVLHHRPPALPADKVALGALRRRMELDALRGIISGAMRRIELERFHVTLSKDEIRDAMAAFCRGPQTQALVKDFYGFARPLASVIADVYEKGLAPDAAYRELVSRPGWGAFSKETWEIWLKRLKTSKGRGEFLAGPAAPSQVQQLALDTKLIWAVDAEIGKTNPDVARYAATEAGVWPNMTEHPVIPEAIIQARNQWWQKELARVGVRIVDPELKGALPLTGPG